MDTHDVKLQKKMANEIESLRKLYMDKKEQKDALAEELLLKQSQVTSLLTKPPVLMMRTHVSVKNEFAPLSTDLLSTSSGPSSSLAISHSPTKTSDTFASQLPEPIAKETPVKCTKCSGVVEDTKDKVTDLQGNFYHQKCLQYSLTWKGKCCLCDEGVFGNQPRKRYFDTKQLYHAKCSAEKNAKRQKI